MELSVIVKAQKIHESDGCPKAKDYDNLTCTVLTPAVHVFRSLLCTQDNGSFQDHTNEVEYARTAWRKACKELEVKLEMTPQLLKMVCVI